MGKNEKKLAEIMESSPGGWEEAKKTARENWEKACRENTSSETSSNSNSVTNSSPSNNSTSSLASSTLAVADKASTEKGSEEVSTLRHRTSQARRHEPLSDPQPSRKSEVPQEGIETLTWHPREEISHLAIAIAEDKEFLTSSGPQQNTFAINVS